MTNALASLVESTARGDDSYRNLFTQDAVNLMMVTPLLPELNKAVKVKTDQLQIDIAMAQLSLDSKEQAKVPILQAEYNNLTKSSQGQSGQVQSMMSTAKTMVQTVLGEKGKAFDAAKDYTSISSLLQTLIKK